jgi:rhamnulokinase
MSGSTHLAFDLGAESGRAVLGALEGGRLSLTEVSRFGNGVLTLRGRKHWNVFRLYEEMKRTLGRCAAAPPESLGVDTWGVDFALLGPDGGVLGLPFAYRDPHTAGAMASFCGRLPAGRLYALTGIQLLPFNTLFQLEAMRRDRSPQLAAATDLLLMPDLFHYLLGGVKRSEATIASTTQLLSPLTRSWEPEVVAALGLPRPLLPEIVAPGTVIGRLEDEVCVETGCPAVPLVAVATHDTASAVAAVPATGTRWAFLSCGTWALLGVESARPIMTPAARAANFTNEGGLGGTYRVLKNIMGLWLLQESRRVLRGDVSYAEITAQAAAAPPLVSLVDPDRPELLAPADMPAAIRSCCTRTGQPAPHTLGELARCILESLALKFRFVLAQLRDLGCEVDCLHLVGGGAQNALLCQLTADATGLPVRAGPVEATAIGNLLVQAQALGHLASPEELRAVVARSFPTTDYSPHPTPAWEQAFTRFTDLCHHGAVQSWTAPPEDGPAP